MKRTYDCEPTLTDAQVIDFCSKGFLMLEEVVPDSINQRTLQYLDENPSTSPIEMLEGEDWFVDNVILHPEAAGAVRSLLGKDFGLPNTIANHRVECPAPVQDWHIDGGSKYTSELNYLQVFYYPQDCPREMGPTELLPGSHFLVSRQLSMNHYGGIRGSYQAIAPAGTIFITVYSIWHRRAASTATGVRNNMKYNYWRTTPPQRDWVVEPEFDVSTADFSLGVHRPQKGAINTFRDLFRDAYDAAAMYAWLCGKSDQVRMMGGQGWPMPPHNLIGGPYGVPAALLENP